MQRDRNMAFPITREAFRFAERPESCCGDKAAVLFDPSSDFSSAAELLCASYADCARVDATHTVVVTTIKKKVNPK